MLHRRWRMLNESGLSLCHYSAFLSAYVCIIVGRKLRQRRVVAALAVALRLQQNKLAHRPRQWRPVSPEFFCRRMAGQFAHQRQVGNEIPGGRSRKQTAVDQSTLQFSNQGSQRRRHRSATGPKQPVMRPGAEAVRPERKFRKTNRSRGFDQRRDAVDRRIAQKLQGEMQGLRPGRFAAQCLGMLNCCRVECGDDRCRWPQRKEQPCRRQRSVGAILSRYARRGRWPGLRWLLHDRGNPTSRWSCP